MHTKLPLDQAVEQVGSQQALADALGIKSPSITEWRQRGRVPAERCIAIEKATGGAVTRYELRPDVFGAAPASNDAGPPREPDDRDRSTVAAEGNSATGNHDVLDQAA